MAFGAYARLLAYLLKRGVTNLTGTDSFRRPQVLGKYFQDPRCYYIDMMFKADWRGLYLDDVPACYVPTSGMHRIFPIMVLQYGLAHLDRLFLYGDESSRTAIRNVTKWLVKNIGENDHYDNLFPESFPSLSFYSSNSCLAQGQALSFSIRVIDNRLVEDNLLQRLPNLVRRIAESMLRPLEECGTTLRMHGGLYLCEFPQKDENVVWNGWIFGIFGLIDYSRWSGFGPAKDALDETLATLKRDLPAFVTPDGWSYYDNKKWRASLLYHVTHIHLLKALALLTGEQEFAAISQRFAQAYTFTRKAKYVLLSGVNRLRSARADAAAAAYSGDADQ